MTSPYKKLPTTTVDPIMLANASWPAFERQHKDAVNTTIGIMIDPATHKPWQPESVTAARERALKMIDESSAFGYQTQSGHADFITRAADYVLGEKVHSAINHDLLSYETLGGTGALSLTKEALLEILNPSPDGSIPIFLDPGWPNHPAIFSDPFRIQSYDHLAADGRYDHAAAMSALGSTKPGNTVAIFQAGGYNDDGADRSPEQWQEVAGLVAEKGIVAVVDAAYLGLCEGPEADRYPIQEFMRRGVLTFVCASFSKNMGLYNERLGVLLVANAATDSAFDQKDNLHQCIMRIVRRTISSAPRLSAQAASLTLADPSFFGELDVARKRLQENRRIFAETIETINPYVAAGHGMFTKLYPGGFSERQTSRLADRGILVLGNSRINLGGMDAAQVERVGQEIRATV